MLIMGTGIYYSFAMFIVKNKAVQQSREQAIESQNFEVLTLSKDIFASLSKEKLAENVFELRYNGIEYDVYHVAENKDGTIALSAIADVREMQLEKNFGSLNERSTDKKTENIPLYIFYYFQTSQNFSCNKIEIKNVFISNSSRISNQNTLPVLSPPPEKIFCA